MNGSDRGKRQGYGAVIRQREFAALLAARILSDWGDHIARVAIAALMLEATGSAALSAAVFAVSLLPTIFGQALLGPYADRLPRRQLLVGCDVLRAVLVLLLVFGVQGGVPLWVLLVLLFLVELVGSPFFAANQALLSDVFPDRREFLLGNSLLRVIGQVNQVVGLAVGGLLVALITVSGALWLDVASFVVSAVLLTIFVRNRPAAAAGGLPGVRELLTDVQVGSTHLRGDPSLRALMLLAWGMTIVFTAPEAAALAYAREQGEGVRIGGLLLAAPPLGAAIGVYVVSRWDALVQVRRILPMAGASTVPLLLVVFAPPWELALVLFLASGLCQGFMVPLLATFTVLAPDHLRGRVNGLAGAGFSAITAAAFLLVGGIADLSTPAFAVMFGGAVGCLVLAWTWTRWPRRELREAAETAYSTAVPPSAP